MYHAISLFRNRNRTIWMRIFIVTLVFLVVGGFFSSLMIKQYNSKRNFQALKHLPRENIQLATNFGIVKMDLNNVVINGTPEYVLSCCEDSLKHLGLEYIDLYYQHWIDTTVPIEETVCVTVLLSPFLKCIFHVT